MGILVRILLIALIFWGIYRLVRKYLASQQEHLEHDERAELKKPSSNDAMRKCAYCQVHIPEGESTRSRGHYFCSEAHRDAFFNQNS